MYLRRKVERYIPKFLYRWSYVVHRGWLGVDVQPREIPVTGSLRHVPNHIQGVGATRGIGPPASGLA